MQIATIGKVIKLADVDNADNLLSAEVICGKSGKWTGVIAKNIWHRKWRSCRGVFARRTAPRNRTLSLYGKSKVQNFHSSLSWGAVSSSDYAGHG